MINAVQLLYNHDSLDVDIRFLIKRLEILQTDPPKLERSYNIDRYLASFCKVRIIIKPMAKLLLDILTIL